MRSSRVLSLKPWKVFCTNVRNVAAEVGYYEHTDTAVNDFRKVGGVDGTRAKRAERDASRATPENVQPGTDRALARDVAGWTGLEPAASGVTGRRSNQLNYHPNCGLANRSSRASSARVSEGWWAVQDSNLRQPACKAGALPLS